MDPNQADDIVFDGDIHDSQFAYLFQSDDIPFWVTLAREFGPRVLELACGTGRITIPIAVSGVAIDGLDFSESMLKGARERAVQNNAAITFYQNDLRRLEFDATYDFIFLPTGTFTHLLTRSDVEAFLAGVRRALKSNGVLAIDVHNPTMSWLKVLPLPMAPNVNTFMHRKTHEQITVTSTSTYQADRQIVNQYYHYIFTDGTIRESTVVLKLYFPVELETLLYYNGFTIQQMFGSYAREPFVAQSSRHIILAQKAKGENR